MQYEDQVLGKPNLRLTSRELKYKFLYHSKRQYYETVTKTPNTWSKCREPNSPCKQISLDSASLYKICLSKLLFLYPIKPISS